MSKRQTTFMLALLLVTIFISACTTANAAPPPEEGGALPPVAAVKARESLATYLGVDIAEVAFESFEQAEWTDSCLGLGGPAESCLAAAFPGWLVMLEVGGNLYEVHTDELGDIIRIKP